MAQIFLSHSSVDKAEARALRGWLVERGLGDVFVDDDTYDGIFPGENWIAALLQKMQQCQVVFILYSEKAARSSWCFAEWTLARYLYKPVQIVRLDDTDLPPLLAEIHTIRFEDLWTQRGDFLFDSLVYGSDGLPPFDPDRPPYPGLSAFDEEDEAYFFGRETDVAEVVAELNMIRDRQPATPRFVVLYGISGCGKSSLMRAGVLPRLRREGRDRGRNGRWCVIPTMIPGDAPGKALCDALRDAQIDIGEAAELDDPINPANAARVLTAALSGRLEKQPGAAYLLVIDQLDELLIESENVERFLSMLAIALPSIEGRLIVLATLRADLLADFMALPIRHEGELNYCRQLEVRPLDIGRVGDVISKPAKRAGLDVQPDLVAKMLSVVQTPDMLPLLAYALNGLWWRCRERGVLTLRDYEDMKGLDGAIQRQAEEATARGGVSIEKAVSLFVGHFVNIFESRAPIRRTVESTDLSGEGRALLEFFVDARLVVRSGEKQASGDAATNTSARTIYRVAHDTVFSGWQELAKRIEADQETIEHLNDLRQAALHWQKRDEPAHLLNHRGDGSKKIRRMIAKSRYAEAMGATATRYLAACDADDAAERRARRRRWVGMGTLGGITVAAATAVFLLLSALNTNKETNRINLYTERAQEKLDAGELDDALWYALEAWPREPGEEDLSRLFEVAIRAGRPAFVSGQLMLTGNRYISLFQEIGPGAVMLLTDAGELMVGYDDDRPLERVDVGEIPVHRFYYDRYHRTIDMISSDGRVHILGPGIPKPIGIDLGFVPDTIIRTGESAFFANNSETVHHIVHTTDDHRGAQQRVYDGSDISARRSTNSHLVFKTGKGTLLVNANNPNDIRVIDGIGKIDVFGMGETYIAADRDRIAEYDLDRPIEEEQQSGLEKAQPLYAANVVILRDRDGTTRVWDHDRMKPLPLPFRYWNIDAQNAEFAVLRTEERMFSVMKLDSLALTPFKWPLPDNQGVQIRMSGDDGRLIVRMDDRIEWVDIDLDPVDRLCEYLPGKPLPDDLAKNPCDILRDTPPATPDQEGRR